MAQDALNRIETCAGDGHQLVAHALEVLADNVEIGVRKKMVNVGHPTGHRILDRDHRIARLARSHRYQHILERWAGDCIEIRIGLAASEMRVGTGLALIGDARADGVSRSRRISSRGPSSAALRRRAAVAGGFRHGHRGR